MGMNEPGYERLADVLHRAYDQAAIGKGRERHAKGEPFHEQVMQIGASKFGVGSLLFQAFKKSEESQRLPHDKAVAELLGAINYLAGAVIALEREHAAAAPTPAPVAASAAAAWLKSKTCPCGLAPAGMCQCAGQSGQAHVIFATGHAGGAGPDGQAAT